MLSWRDVPMPKQMFDCHTNKSTGNPTCPAPKRREKYITRSILGQSHAATLSGGDNTDEDTVSHTGLTPRNALLIGVPAWKRQFAAGSVCVCATRVSTDNALIFCVSKFAGSPQFLGCRHSTLFTTFLEFRLICAASNCAHYTAVLSMTIFNQEL